MAIDAAIQGGLGVKFDLYGSDEMRKNIESLDKALAKKVIRAALRKGAAVALKRARQLVPVESGLLRQHLKVKVGKIRNDELKEARVYLTVGKGERVERRRDRKTGEVRDVRIFPARYAFPLEYGTKHRKAHPFFRPAIQQTKPEFVAELHRAIIEAWNKHVVAKGL